MYLYKSLTNRTVPSNGYQVTADPGVLLPLADKDLDALVADGQLSVEVLPDAEPEAPVAKKTEPVKPGATK